MLKYENQLFGEESPPCPTFHRYNRVFLCNAGWFYRMLDGINSLKWVKWGILHLLLDKIAWWAWKKSSQRCSLWMFRCSMEIYELTHHNVIWLHTKIDNFRRNSNSHTQAVADGKRCTYHNVHGETSKPSQKTLMLLWNKRLWSW